MCSSRKLQKHFADVDPAEATSMDVSFKNSKESTTWITYEVKYTQDELSWLSYGMRFRNPHARHASSAVILAKQGEYRLCDDVKRPNLMVQSTHWPIPHIDDILRKLSKSSSLQRE